MIRTTSRHSVTRSAGLLEQPDEIVRLGVNAVGHVVDHFVGDRHLLRYGTLLEEMFDLSPTEDRSG